MALTRADLRYKRGTAAAWAGGIYAAIMSFLQRLRSKAPTPPPQEPEEPLVCELSEADLENARLAYQKNYNYGYMNCGKGSAVIVAVAGTSHHQHALREVATTPRPWRHPSDRHLPAVLVPERDNPYDENAARVLIDGYMVGRLPREMAVERRSLLDELAASKQRLVCAALIVGGGPDKNYGVRLQVKPSIGTRWAKDGKPSEA